MLGHPAHRRRSTRRWRHSINTLYDELSNPIPERAVIGGQVLEGLVDYTHNHFIEEEVMFQRYGYPQTAEHTAEHAHFTAQAMDWLLRFEAGRCRPGGAGLSKTGCAATSLKKTAPIYRFSKRPRRRRHRISATRSH